MNVRIPFEEHWQEAMLAGRKVCTSRVRRCGGPGDVFEAFGATFELVAVERLPLEDVRDTFYQDEGCKSPDAFEHAWSQLHPRKGFVPGQMVYAHRFTRRGAPWDGQATRGEKRVDPRCRFG